MVLNFGSKLSETRMAATCEMSVTPSSAAGACERQLGAERLA
jgi:hypothetical protein